MGAGGLGTLRARVLDLRLGLGQERAGCRRLGQGLEDQEAGGRSVDILGRGTDRRGNVTVQTSRQPLVAPCLWLFCCYQDHR